MIDAPIIWIASYPKSGSTWLRLFLHAYATGRLNINNAPSSTGDKQPYFWHAVSHRPILDCTPTELACLRPAMLCHLIEANPARPLPVKTHHCNASLDDFPLIPTKLTQAAIYIVRDPRDVALSYANHFDVAVDDAIESLCDSGRMIKDSNIGLPHYLSDWSSHVRSWLAKKDYPVALIKYERMHEAPHAVFEAALKVLGEDEPDRDRIGSAVRLTSFERLRAQETERGFVERPRDDMMFFREGTRDQWRTKLTIEQIERIESVHSEMMTQLGYDLSTATAPSRKTNAA